MGKNCIVDSKTRIPTKWDSLYDELNKYFILSLNVKNVINVKEGELE